MKKEVVEYLCDSFVDFMGKEHKFVLCAVSRVNENVEVFFNDTDTFVDSARTLTVGWSVCNTVDEFDEELGKEIAYNRAVNSKYLPDIVSTVPGIINTKLVMALLEQEAEYIKRDPNCIIPGYNEKMKKVQSEISAVLAYDDLTDDEKKVVDILKNTPDLLEVYADIAKNLPNN